MTCTGCYANWPLIDTKFRENVEAAGIPHAGCARRRDVFHITRADLIPLVTEPAVMGALIELFEASGRRWSAEGWQMAQHVIESCGSQEARDAFAALHLMGALGLDQLKVKDVEDADTSSKLLGLDGIGKGR